MQKCMPQTYALGGVGGKSAAQRCFATLGGTASDRTPMVFLGHTCLNEVDGYLTPGRLQRYI